MFSDSELSAMGIKRADIGDGIIRCVGGDVEFWGVNIRYSKMVNKVEIGTIYYHDGGITDGDYLEYDRMAREELNNRIINYL